MSAAQVTFEQIRLLQEENRRLRDALAPQITFPREWALYAAEKATLAALFGAKGPVSREALLAVASRPGSEPHVVTVHICRLRKKLKHLGIRILTDWSKGYELTPKSREIIKGSLQ